MKLDLDYYNLEENKVKNNTEDNIIQMNQNILNWYPFKEKSSVLEIGTNYGEITKVLCKRVEKVTTIESDLEKAKKIAKDNEKSDNLTIIVGEFNNIKFEEKFDYITLIGTLPYISKANNNSSKEFIQRLNSILKPDGKLLIAVDNKFGIKYFVGNPDPYLQKKFVSILNYNDEEDKIETYTKQKLIDILDSNGYVTKNFYYPLPDYRMPNVIFSDLELPKYNNIAKYNPYHTEKSDILMNEIDLFREILKTDDKMFTFFTNAYFIEASREEQIPKYKYISYNNLRKPEYRLITKIGNDYVEKEVVDEKANNHYEQIKENIEILNKAKINTLDELNDNKIRSKYIEQENMLSNVLVKKLEENDIEEFFFIIDRYYEEIKKVSNYIEDKSKTIFEDYDIEITEEQRENLHFIKIGLWDMTFKNCFYIDNNFYFFDQEWKDENIPVEYILYRAIVYTISLRRFIDINKILERYELDKYLDIFKKLDEQLQIKIRDEKLWEYYNKQYYFDIDATKQEMANMQKRSDAKDLAIQNLEKKVRQLEDTKLTAFIKTKVRRWIRRK